MKLKALEVSAGPFRGGIEASVAVRASGLRTP